MVLHFDYFMLESRKSFNPVNHGSERF